MQGVVRRVLESILGAFAEFRVFLFIVLFCEFLGYSKGAKCHRQRYMFPCLNHQKPFTNENGHTRRGKDGHWKR